MMALLHNWLILDIGGSVAVGLGKSGGSEADNIIHEINDREGDNNNLAVDERIEDCLLLRWMAMDSAWRR